METTSSQSVCTDYKTAALQDECQSPLLKSKCPKSCNACFEDNTHVEEKIYFLWKGCEEISEGEKKVVNEEECSWIVL